MKKIIDKRFVRDYFLIIIGATLLAAGLSMFFDPLNMVIGGVTGLAIVIKEITKDVIGGGVPLYVSNLVINIPLFILALIFKGKDFGGKSLFATIYLSVALYYTKDLPAITDEIFGITDKLLLGCVFGAVISGIGLGMVFMAGATTGGTDLVAALLQMIFKHRSIATLMMAVDGMIIAIGFFVFGAEKTMYAIIAVFITAKIIDAILEGVHFSKAAFIISDKEAEISIAIFDNLDRGITGIKGEGRYTQIEKKLLLCVVSKKEIVLLKELVRAIDPAAFVIVADVREVLGEGFIEYQNN